MVRWLICIGLYVVFVPRGLVHAIPPPDLLISVFQSLLATLGVIAASLVLAYTAVKNYIHALLPSRRHRVLFFGLVLFVSGLLVCSLFIVEKNAQLHSWQTGVNEEIGVVWEQYYPVYNSADELTARQDLVSVANEVTWSEFKNSVGDREYQIVDIRDVHPYTMGHFPSSIHMRFADVLHGGWKELLPYKNQPIFIVCFFGTTGSLTANFLAEKGFTELYIPKDGLRKTTKREATPFVGTGGFPHGREMIQRLSNEEVLDLQTRGAQLIDVRSPNFYNENESINGVPDHQFLREFETTEAIDLFMSSLDPAYPYLSICNSELSCYHGEMLLHDLKAVGLSAAGTYNTSLPEGKKW